MSREDRLLLTSVLNWTQPFFSFRIRIIHSLLILAAPRKNFALFRLRFDIPKNAAKIYSPRYVYYRIFFFSAGDEFSEPLSHEIPHANTRWRKERWNCFLRRGCWCKEFRQHTLLLDRSKIWSSKFFRFRRTFQGYFAYREREIEKCCLKGRAGGRRTRARRERQKIATGPTAAIIVRTRM